MKVNMHEAKSQLPQLGELAWEGEEVVITKGGKPYLLLKPYRERRVERQPGGLEGKIRMSPNFDEPDQELFELLENSKIFPDSV